MKTLKSAAALPLSAIATSSSSSLAEDIAPALVVVVGRGAAPASPGNLHAACHGSALPRRTAAPSLRRI